LKRHAKLQVPKKSVLQWMDTRQKKERKKKMNGKGTEVAANKATVMKQYRLVL
jgi:hypothetical protein